MTPPGSGSAHRSQAQLLFGTTSRMTSMPSYSRHDVVLVRYPFSDLSSTNVRPAVVVSAPHVSTDVIVVPLASRTSDLLPGEFALQEWASAGLNVPTAAKRGLFTLQASLI